MRLIVLGCGGSVPDGSRNGPGFWIEGEEAKVLLDCGAGILPALPRRVRDWTGITHIFLSHFHIDHVVELPAILFALEHAPGIEERTAPLEILGPPGTARLVGGLESAFERDFTQQRFDVAVREVGPGNAHAIAPGCTLRVLSVPHTDESLAVRIDERGAAVGYTGDTAPSPDLAAFFRGCDVLIADCSLDEPSQGAGHLSVEETARLASDASVPRLVATHLFPGLDPAKTKKRLEAAFPGEVQVARDGLSFDM
ncbi:MAG: ribonuclease Z [Deltaproteobacteria bacterium]|nr:ribonuclease Z [Deltaproteobacteria bacterium]